MFWTSFLPFPPEELRKGTPKLQNGNENATPTPISCHSLYPLTSLHIIFNLLDDTLTSLIPKYK